jgi:GWxTD domain-containing protein
MEIRVRSLMVAGLLLAVLASAGALLAEQEGLSGPAADETLAAWTTRWIDGPVSALATDEEKALYAELGNTTERLQFIRLFWERRDPTPRGPENEFLDEFAERVQFADSEYTTSREAGWETVFGQVVLMLGPPARTRRELGLPAGFSDRPPILWSYDDRVPGLEPNEDLLFAFRAGTWRLMPPYPLDNDPVGEQMRQQERNSDLAFVPGNYQQVFDRRVEESLRNTVNYAAVRDSVETSVQLPDSQIPFSWTADVQNPGGAQRTVELRLTWRLDSLVFHLVEGVFTTDMRVDIQALQAGEPIGIVSERVIVEVPEAEMAGRREEIVRRTLTLTLPPGDYDLEFAVLDRLLGFRSLTAETLAVR